MANFENNSHKEAEEIKTIEDIMNNAYKIAESSGFYTPINKEDWKK